MLVANVVAGPISNPQEIVRRLVEQVTGTVRWRECVGYMATHGVNRFWEIGAGKVPAKLPANLEQRVGAHRGLLRQ